MKRDQLQQRIADLDKKINDELATTKLPDSNRRRAFPIVTWLLAAACFGLPWYGNMIPQAESIYATISPYAPYAGGILGLYAALKTVLFMLQPRTIVGEKYVETTARVREMQEERRRLMADLKAIEE